jgi:hypothetical protein
MAPPNQYNRFPGRRPVQMAMRQNVPVRRPPGFRGFGACTPACAGNTGQVTGPVPPQMGGNAVQGQGIDFFYATAATSVANGASSSAIPIQFDANSVFIWQRSTFAATIAHAAFVYDSIPIPNINVLIQDTGKGASFMNTPININSIASNIPGLSYILPVPQLIQANASFTWTFTNFDAADTYTDLQFHVHGFRVFDPTITSLQQLFQQYPGLM